MTKVIRIYSKKDKFKKLTPEQEGNLSTYVSEFKKGKVRNPRVDKKLIPNAGFKLRFKEPIFHGHLTNSRKAVITWIFGDNKDNERLVVYIGTAHPDIRDTPAAKKVGFSYKDIADFLKLYSEVKNITLREENLEQVVDKIIK